MRVSHILPMLLPLLLTGCLSFSSSAPPRQTTVIVPPSSSTTVVCSNGVPGPCN